MTRLVTDLLSPLRDEGVRPQWNLAITLIVALLLAVGIAAGLGDASRAIYTVFPLVLTLIFGSAAGTRTGAVVGLVTTLLVALAAVASATPITAALAFAAVLVWLTVPSRFAPSTAVAPLLQLAYFIVAAFGQSGTAPLQNMVFAAGGYLIGLTLVAAISAVRRAPEAGAPADDRPTPGGDDAVATPASSTPGVIAAKLVAALVAGALLYWRVATNSQDVAWILLTFVLVLQPSHVGTMRQSLGRLVGTIAGFAAVVALFALLPRSIATAIGLAAIVPAVAYPKRDYILSVVATTVSVVTIYGMPDGEYLAWGLDRTTDTLIGVVLAVGLSIAIRQLDPGRGTESAVRERDLGDHESDPEEHR